MIIFSITLFPLLAVFINLLLDVKITENRYSGITYLKGALTFIPAVFILMLSEGLIKKTNTYSNIFLFHMIYDFAIWFLIVYFGYTYLFKNSMVYKLKGKISEVFTYACGFYSVLAFYDALYLYRWENPYLLFILPSARLLQVFLFSILLPLFYDSSGYLKYFYIICVFMLPSITAMIPFFFYLNMFFIVGIIYMVLIVLSLWLFSTIVPFSRKKCRI